MSLPSKGLDAFVTSLNNNYHLVHHDLPHVPWFALREVYETSREQYIERSGAFIYKGYSGLAWRHLFRVVSHPIYSEASDSGTLRPLASAHSAGKSRVKLGVSVHTGAPYEAHTRPPSRRQATGQAL
jgi:hypothetical protein